MKFFKILLGRSEADALISRLGVRNSRSTPHMVIVEPWADDYTLLPGEELEVIAIGEEKVPYFYLVECEGASQVYCEDTRDFKVMQNGSQLECGHNRQPK